MARPPAAHHKHMHAALPQEVVPRSVATERKGSRRSFKVLSQLSAVGQTSWPQDSNLVVDLDWKPHLSRTQDIICVSIAAAVCALLYVFTAPTAFSILYATAIGVIFGCLLLLLRTVLLEELYKAKERMVVDLGDADSTFTKLENLNVHVKVKEGKGFTAAAAKALQNNVSSRSSGSSGSSSTASQPQPPVVPALHCYHGFGSNTWSWSLVQQSIANRLSALVTAHDMPGFGLTQRPSDMSGYYLAFNGRLGRLALDHELAARGLLSEAQRQATAQHSMDTYPIASVHDQASSADSASSSSPSAAAERAVESGLEAPTSGAVTAAAQGNIGGAVTGAAKAVADTVTGPKAAGSTGTHISSSVSSTNIDKVAIKRVLVGHSLGGACAALEAISDPSSVAALVMVAPAIITFGDGSSTGFQLERLQDGSAFTKTMSSLDADEAALQAIQAASTLSKSASSSSSTSGSELGSSADLDALAAASQFSTVDNVGSSASQSTPLHEHASNRNGGSADGASKPSHMIAGAEVVCYVARGETTSPTDTTEQKPLGWLAQLKQRLSAIGQSFMLIWLLATIAVLRPAILLALRAAVRSRSFWLKSLQQAYYDPSKVDAKVVDAYRLPQLAQGWDSGMIQFVLARLGATGTGIGFQTSSMEDRRLAERLGEVVAQHKIPVLIIHGQADKLVPCSASFRLAKQLKGARLAVMKKCGHCPQEELPEAFAELVVTFLTTTVLRGEAAKGGEPVGNKPSASSTLQEDANKTVSSLQPVKGGLQKEKAISITANSSNSVGPHTGTASSQQLASAQPMLTTDQAGTSATIQPVPHKLADDRDGEPDTSSNSTRGTAAAAEPAGSSSMHLDSKGTGSTILVTERHDGSVLYSFED
eukprot:jgi/Chrzof1/5053/Cz15g10010.t1